MRSVIAFLLAGGSVVTVACLRDVPAESRLRIEIDTVGHVQRIVSSGIPPQWTLSEVARIGSVIDGPAAFGRVRSIVLDGAGNVYVADEQAARIQVFDTTGQYVRTIGARGAGPAEFQTPYSLGWFGDTLAVLDPRNARIGRFLRQGAWMGSWRWQPLSGPNIHLLNGSPRDLYAPVLRRFAAGAGQTFVYVDGPTLGDTMAMPARPKTASTGPICRYPNEGGIEFFGIPFGPELHVAGGPDKTLFVGWSAVYRIAQITQLGDTVRVIERTLAAVPISDAEWDERTSRYRRMREDHPGAECEPSEQPRPASKPSFRWIGQSMDHGLWVEVYTPEGFVFEVFDPTGRLIGRLPAPTRDRRVPPVTSGDRLAIVARDSLDVQYVELYRVMAGTR